MQQFITGLAMGDAGASQVAITLGSLMNAAVEDGLIGRNPLKARSVKVPSQPKAKSSPRRPCHHFGERLIATGVPGLSRCDSPLMTTFSGSPSSRR